MERKGRARDPRYQLAHGSIPSTDTPEPAPGSGTVFDGEVFEALVAAWTRILVIEYDAAVAADRVA
jgi:hypothetical protein